MSLLLVAHGTRKRRGVSLIGDLAAQVSSALDRPVHVAFVDVLGPTPAELLAATPDRPTVLVPAFLSRGYHVSSDIPDHVTASGHPDVTVTRALGPDPQLVRVLVDRLIESGWRPDDSVVLAAAGTSDRGAMRDLHTTAAWLSATIGSRVELAFAATGEPRIADAVAALRGRGRRVVVASYLLSEGLFQDRLRDSGADVVTDPLGTHPGVARLIVSRFQRAGYDSPAEIAFQQRTFEYAPAGMQFRR
ncbi:sirohydrochlorin chelatase [Mycolicibacterium gilvum]|uniref:Cobalamin (Vitamin B12) biosynthesis CbiX protein n=1 Tax=Mycolicibacterium gilvum TaxID=1804 RepID=A0A378SGZ4_9MYCO|nr:sirohydrochlorin chelatase [Mycolicibacterium gilvum]MCV7056397.1 sirohydrochlorin chelatase [Mycolicibacterium gilvum]STZ41084.1 cobalamin (vitamin B12) biosynthesis CbiX protein [Mycolicibacterium gilvum]